MPTKLICCAMLFFCVAFQGVSADTMYENRQMLEQSPDSVREPHSLFFEPLDNTQVSIAPEISAISFEYSGDLEKALREGYWISSAVVDGNLVSPVE